MNLSLAKSVLMPHVLLSRKKLVLLKHWWKYQMKVLWRHECTEPCLIQMKRILCPLNTQCGGFEGKEDVYLGTLSAEFCQNTLASKVWIAPLQLTVSVVTNIQILYVIICHPSVYEVHLGSRDQGEASRVTLRTPMQWKWTRTSFSLACPCLSTQQFTFFEPTTPTSSICSCCPSWEPAAL